MNLPEAVTDDVVRRLHRVAGQVNAIERMLESGRECRDIVTQVSAATKALEQIGFRIVAAGLTYCLERPEDAHAEGYSLDDVQKMFMKLA